MSSQRKQLRRLPPFVILLIVGLVVLYAVVVALYALSSRPNAVVLSDPPEAGKIGLTLRAESVQAVGNRLGATIDVTEAGPLSETGTTALAAPISVIVTENDGPRVVDFSAGTVISPASLSLMTDGYVELWPFDRYTVTTTIVVHTQDDVVVPSDITLLGGVPGWTLQAEARMLGATVVSDADGGTQEVPSLVITATRSGATIAFGIVLLALMVVMPVLVLLVAILTYTGRRKVEATLLSWNAAMLFATIPLRTFLPGSPPVGSWIDFLIVLWVLFALVTGLTIYVLAWRRWSPALVDGAPLPLGVPVKERVDLAVVHAGEGAAGQR